MSATKKSGTNLLALTTAALCLPGYAGDAAAWADPESTAAYRFSYYSEAGLPAAATNGRDGSRYQIQTHQFHLLRPWGEEYDWSADVMVEAMSGASPWFIVPGANRQPIQVMSGATIDEQRVALDFKGRRYREDGRDALRLSVSKEEDYFSLSTGAETEQEFDDGARTLTAGLGFSHDELSPTDGGSSRYPDRIADASKNSWSAYAGLAQVIDAQTLAQLSLSYTRDDGYLSDPYKQAFVAADLLPDARPNARDQGALSARLRHYYTGLNAALHLDYRYFQDSWGVSAHTAELGWHQNLGQRWNVIPSVRWYQQSAADFYQPFYDAARDDGHYSSDYRLSAYGALSLRLGATYDARSWTAGVSVERYDSAGSYRIGGVESESPSLVDFSVVSASFSYRF